MTEEEKQPVTPELVSQLAITSPQEHDTIEVVEDGETNMCYAKIRGTINTSWSSTVIVAFFDADTFDPSIHLRSAGVTAHIDDSNVFSHNAVPFPHDTGHAVAVAWQQNSSGQWIAVSEPYLTLTKVNTQAVTAKSCPWFANAGDNYQGPDVPNNDPRESGVDFRPIEFIPPPAPAAVTTITIENTTTGNTWTNDEDGSSYSADGTGASTFEVNSRYLNEFGFPAMQPSPLTAKLGTLVAVVIYEDSSGNEHAGSLLLVGTGSVTADITTGSGASSKRAKRIIVGFFDGYEWANNAGSMTVKVSYS